MEFMTKIKLVVVATLVTLALVIFFQNWKPYELEVLWFGGLPMPGSVLLIMTLLFGVFLGFIASAFLRRRKAKSKAG